MATSEHTPPASADASASAHPPADTGRAARVARIDADSTRAQGALQKFKFNLGWKVEASGAGFLLALQRGYYKDLGLDVQIDTGNGSASATTRC